MDLKIGFEETRSVGTQVTAKGGEFASLLSKIQASNNELRGFWEGDDATKYLGAVEEQAEYMKKLATTIDEIGAFLVKAADAYQEAVEANASGIR